MFYPGHNEELVGKAIEPFRDEIVLTTKFHMDPDEYGDDVTLYKAIRKHRDASLERLRTDYIDLYYLHRVNEEVPVEDVAEVMGRLIDEGLIKGWGLSQVNVEILDKAHKVIPMSAVQNLYNMMERTSEDEIFPYYFENNTGVVPFSPIASGFLSGKVTTERNLKGMMSENLSLNYLQRILKPTNPFWKEQYADEKDATNAQISLAWILHKYPNVVPIPDRRNREESLKI